MKKREDMTFPFAEYERRLNELRERMATRLLDAAARAVLGPEAVVLTEQSLGGEDFGWLLTRSPGAMARLGTRTPGGHTYDLHQGDLDVEEGAISVGARLLVQVALMAGAAVATED